MLLAEILRLKNSTGFPTAYLKVQARVLNLPFAHVISDSELHDVLLEALTGFRL